jgi:hypothetical protein
MTLLPDRWLSSRWGWLVVTAAVLVGFMLIVAVLALVGAHPQADLTARGIAGYAEEQCERLRTGAVLVQVVNFWSNAAYVAVGLLVSLRSEDLSLRIVGGALVLLGACSGWFHGFKTEFGQTLDIVGVYLVLLAIIIYGVLELLHVTDRAVIWISMGGALMLSIVTGFLRSDVDVFDSDVFTPILATIVVLGMLTVFAVAYFGGNPLWRPLGNVLLVTVGLGLLALVFKYTDGTDNAPLANHNGNIAECLYDPDSPLQGHALWHILSALMFLGMIEFFRVRGYRTESVLR